MRHAFGLVLGTSLLRIAAGRHPARGRTPHGTVCEQAEPQPCRAFQEPRAAPLLLQRAGDWLTTLLPKTSVNYGAQSEPERAGV